MSFKNILTLFKKELRTYFYTPLAYVFIGVFTCMMGFMFLLFLQAYLQYSMQASIGGAQELTIDRLAEAFYGNMNMLLMFVLPFFTMGLFTDETKKNTLVLLMTSPIRNSEITLAKFFSAVTMLAIMLLLTMAFPGFLYLFSSGGIDNGPDPGVLFTTYLGLFLVGSVYMAVGTFWSSLAKTSLSAVVLTFASLFSMWLISLGAQNAKGLLQEVLNQAAMLNQFNTFLQGTIELKSLVFFVSVIAFMLFLTHRCLESKAWRS